MRRSISWWTIAVLAAPAAVTGCSTIIGADWGELAPGGASGTGGSGGQAGVIGGSGGTGGVAGDASAAGDGNAAAAGTGGASGADASAGGSGGVAAGGGGGIGGIGGTGGQNDGSTGGSGGTTDAGGTADALDSGVCTPTAKQCSGQTPQTCNASGAWENGSACTDPAACFAGACVCAAWTQRSPATSPSARQYSALAFDSVRGKTVLFGGHDVTPPYADLADTWEWDGTSWTKRTPATSPTARNSHALAYDSVRGRTVLFGGVTNVTTNFADTWEWDGTNWALRSSSGGPTGRSAPLAYDSARGRTVLYGGTNGGGNLADTWEWDGTSWTQRTPTSGPGTVFDHALAYDSARGKTVLFGGVSCQGLSCVLSDTWEWDGAKWTKRLPATSPPARYMHALAYDGARGRTVLFGGFGNTNVLLADTWEWDGTNWVQRTPSPSPSGRRGQALAYDSARGRIVLFGGTGGTTLNDTWEYAFGACP